MRLEASCGSVTARSLCGLEQTAGEPGGQPEGLTGCTVTAMPVIVGMAEQKAGFGDVDHAF